MIAGRIAPLYSLFIGFSMIGVWIMFYLTGGIPEIQTKPVELGLHLTAEIATAVGPASFIITNYVKLELD